MRRLNISILFLFGLVLHEARGATVTYGYDSLNRVTSVSWSSGVALNYTYDAAGNRLTYTAIAPVLTISSHPSSASVAVGGNVTFSITATGPGTLSYQWKVNGFPISGANGSSLALSGINISNAGNYTVTVSNANSSVTSQPALLTVLQNSFAGWQPAYFTTGEMGNFTISGMDADPNHDGISNWMSFVLGLNPRGANSPGLVPAASIVSQAGSQYLTFTYRHLIGLTNIPYKVCVSDDLVTWDETESQIEAVGNPVPAGDGIAELVTVRLKTPITGGTTSRKFLRLKVGNPQTIVTLFQDNFNDNSVDSAKWIVNGNTVIEAGQQMQVYTNQTDVGGVLYSQPFQIQGRGVITLTRRAFLHYGNTYAVPDFEIKIGTFTMFRLQYANMVYDSSPQKACYGIYMCRNDGNAHNVAHLSDVSSPMTPIWDTWFDEKIVYEPDTGLVHYSINGTPQIDYNVGILPTTAGTNASIMVNAWGWWTGHSHLFDDLVITQTVGGL